MNDQQTQTAQRGARSAPPSGSAYGVQRISKFLRVASDATNPNERGVMSNDGKLIAILGYYKPWRQWVLYPQPNTVWSTDCLAAINAHLVVLGSRPNDGLSARGGDERAQSAGGHLAHRHKGQLPP